jgi:tRNA pseudouridine55 synthase
MKDGILLVDKPVGFSSFQIVRLFKKRYKKVGHAGTLDPFASGLLIILIDKATKRFADFQTYDKSYSGEILLGYTTDTYDITGTFQHVQACSKTTSFDDLRTVSRLCVGAIDQIPPRFSAIKHKGRRMYELSRLGKKVIPQARKVVVKSFDIVRFEWPVVRFHVIVGKGVYIRSLAHDFGDRLGCGAALLSLRRTCIGPFSLNGAVQLGRLFHTDE